MSLSNIKQLGHLFWCVTFDNLLTFSMLYVQSAIGTAMMEERFGYSEAEAGAIIVTPYMIGAVCMPFVGILADYFGRRQTMLIFGGTVHLIGQILYLTMANCDRCELSIFPQYLFGLNYSFYMVLLWGCMSYLVPERLYSLSAAIITCLMNLGCALLPVIFATLHDSTENWM